MFKIDHLDFIGSDKFNEIVDKLFSNARVERVFKDGIPHVRVYVPKKDDPKVERDEDDLEEDGMPSWRKEVRASAPVKPVEVPSPKEPKSILEMLEDGDERLERLLGKIIDKKLAERNLVDDDDEGDDYDEEDEEDELPKKDPKVFIANRLTFLIQTLFPLVFDTSSIDTDGNCMTVAIDEHKTFPAIESYDDLGYITCQINNSNVIGKEIEEFLDGTEYSNIYCFPIRTVNRATRVSWGVKFVVYPKKA